MAERERPKVVKLERPAAREDAGRASRGLWVSEALRDDIQDGRYAPGDRVTELEVAERLGVSRTPVREALRRLESEGLLVSLPWRGVVVAELDRAQVLELYAMREVLEGTAARFAAQHADAAEIDLMQDLLEREAAAGDDGTLTARINRDLHEAIYTRRAQPLPALYPQRPAQCPGAAQGHDLFGARPSRGRSGRTSRHRRCDRRA